MNVIAVIEVPKGSRKKFAWKDGVFRLTMVTDKPYPLAYGFIPGTKLTTGDRDPLDVLVLSSRPLKTGHAIIVQLVGVLIMKDHGNQDFKLLAIDDSSMNHPCELRQVDPALLARVGSFYDDMGKQITAGWQPKPIAEALIARYATD